MSRFFKGALGALLALPFAAALVFGCSDDEQQRQQPQQQQQEQQQQVASAEQQAQAQEQQERRQSAPAQAASTQEQQAEQQAQSNTQTQAQPQAVSSEPLNIVVSTQVIADWVRQVGGGQVNVYALVPAGADAHILELSVADIRAVAEADLVIINGAGLESFYEDALHENAKQILNLAEAIEEAGYELAPFMSPGSEHEDAEVVGRLLVADGVEAHLSVIDLLTDEVDSGLFPIAAANASVYSSPTHRYGIVLARGPEDGDDRIHVFDGGVFLVEHGDHHDLFTESVSRHALEIAEETPVHTVNNLGWTAIFADANGHVILINEQDLASVTGDYEPLVFEAGPQHGAAVVISEGRLAVTVPHPDRLENPDFWNILPEGVEVRTFDNELVFDAGACHRTHGIGHNAHGAVFGCWTGTLFLHAHDGKYESELIPYPAEAGPEGEFAIGQYFSHPNSDNFFGQSTLFPDGQCCVQGGVWLVDVARGEMREVFPEPGAAAAFSGDGETFFVLAADGILRAFDAHDGEMLGTLQLVDPFEMVFGSVLPAILGLGDMIYVADPNSGHVFAVHLEHMEIEEEWHVGGAPSSLAFVGVTDSGGASHAGHDDHEEEGDDHGHHHHHGSEDPHFWFDVDLASVAIATIADELSHLNPDAADVYSDRLDLYLAEVREADAEARALIENVPEHQRVLVTFHDAFAYFARRYGLEVVGFLIHGPEQGISAGTIAELVELIEDENVETVFHEPQFDSSALDAVALETGARRGVIWSQPTVDNPTYLGILLGNARAIAEQ
jgi:ABC-type Zn uptake system ZnuABC Zn-binding protein ZnuA